MSLAKKAWAMHRENPRMTHQAIADAIGFSRSGVSRTIRKQRATASLRCAHCGSLLPYLKEVLKSK